jgi:hypothetical protein
LRKKQVVRPRAKAALELLLHGMDASSSSGVVDDSWMGVEEWTAQNRGCGFRVVDTDERPYEQVGKQV